MAESFLTLMADLDESAQARLSGWYSALREAGFDGVQTHGLPFHISLGMFPLDRERQAIEPGSTFFPLREAHRSRSVLVAYNAVFVVEAIVRAGIVRALNEACHFVLVEVDETDIAVELIVIDVVRAGLAVCRCFLLHVRYPPLRALRRR